MHLKRLLLLLLLVPSTAFGLNFGDIPATQVMGTPTLVNDTNVTLTLGGAPTDSLLNPFSITAGWTGTLAPGRGGTGVASLGDITKTDDTNVTLTLGGTPTGAVINSTSFTLGWLGTLSLSRGGFGKSQSNPGADRLSLWDNTDGDFEFVTVGSGLTYTHSTHTLSASGSGSGTVTDFSAGDLSPLFTTSVATSTTTPALSFTLDTAGAQTVFGNNTGSTAAPVFSSAPQFLKIGNLTANGLISTSANDGTLFVSDFSEPSPAFGKFSYDRNSGTTLQISNQDSTAPGAGEVRWEFNPYGDTGWISKYSANHVVDLSGGPSDFFIDPGGLGSLKFTLNQGRASSASATLDALFVFPQTHWITGSTNITTATGFNNITFGKPTYNDASAVTITNAANVYIEDAPQAAGSVTITNPYALWVDNGITRLNGGFVFGSGSPTSGKIAQSNGTVYTDSTPTWPTTAGASGNVVTSNGTNFTSSAIPAGRFLNRQYLTTTGSHTYTPTTGTSFILLQMMGGGGAGGGATGGTSACGVGGGGGGGGYLEKIVTSISGTYSYTVGAAGAGGTGTGGNGGDTTFVNGGTTYTAGKGSGGVTLASGTSTTTTAGGAAGTSTNGDLNVSGQTGQRGYRLSGTSGSAGTGGSTRWGQGGLAQFPFASASDAPAGYGAGGGGSLSFTSTNVGGTSGTQGIIIVDEYY